LPERTVLTPHPGEMARLAHIEAGAGRSAVQAVQAQRLELAAEKAALWRCVVLLKGAYSVVADPAGRLAVIPFADAALARAGTGDVLAGIITGLLAQGLDPFDAAAAGAYIHGYAGTLAAAYMGTRASVLATDVAANIHAAITGILETQ
jgi:NAD(P)H-hydrate epimerase